MDEQALMSDHSARIGPFTGKNVYVGLDSLKKGASAKNMNDLAQELLAHDLTAVYPTASIFPASPTQSVDRDYVYWTLRDVYETYPQALDQIIFQWGNEINANGKIFSPNRQNDPAGIPIYSDQYLGPAIEAIKQVEQDLISNGTFEAGGRIPIMAGSIGSSNNPANRNYMYEFMDHILTDEFVSSPDLVGTRVWEHVDIASIHYPFTGISDPGFEAMDEIYSTLVDTGKVDQVWITEEHGISGHGPADLINRSMHFIQWVGENQVSADSTRMMFWSTDAPLSQDPGGKGIEAIEKLGNLFAGKKLSQKTYAFNDDDGADAFVLTASQAISPEQDQIESVTVAIIPHLFPADSAGSVSPGSITVTLPTGVLHTLGEATATQYSLDQLSESWNLQTSWDSSTRTISVDLLGADGLNTHTIDETFLLTIPVEYDVAPPPSSGDLAKWEFTTDMAPTTEAVGVDAGEATQASGIQGNGGGRSSGGQDLFVRTNTAYNGPVVTDGDYLDPNNEAPAVAAEDYFEFTLTPESGYVLDLDGFSYDYYAQDVDGNKGPTPFFKSFLRSSVDGFASTLTSHTFTDVVGTVASDTGVTSTVNVSVTLDSSFDAIDGTTTFRIYFTDGVNAGSNLLIHRIDNVRIQGTAVIAALDGDLDGDGFVGIDDLNLVLGNWNQNVPPGDPLADPSGDGFVGIDDLNTVLGNWNAGTPPAPRATIPEPASAAILLALMGVSLSVIRQE